MTTWMDQPPPRSRKLLLAIAECVAAGGSSRHSAHGRTLRFLIEALEAAGAPYALVARPGEGYVLTGTGTPPADALETARSRAKSPRGSAAHAHLGGCDPLDGGGLST